MLCHRVAADGPTSRLRKAQRVEGGLEGRVGAERGEVLGGSSAKSGQPTKKFRAVYGFAS